MSDDNQLLQSSANPSINLNDEAHYLQESSDVLGAISNTTRQEDEKKHDESISYHEQYAKQVESHLLKVKEALAAARARGDYGTIIEQQGAPVTQDMTFLTTPARLPEDVKKQLDEDNQLK